MEGEFRHLPADVTEDLISKKPLLDNYHAYINSQLSNYRTLAEIKLWEKLKAKSTHFAVEDVCKKVEKYHLYRELRLLRRFL